MEQVFRIFFADLFRTEYSNFLDESEMNDYIDFHTMAEMRFMSEFEKMFSKMISVSDAHECVVLFDLDLTIISNNILRPAFHVVTKKIRDSGARIGILTNRPHDNFFGTKKIKNFPRELFDEKICYSSRDYLSRARMSEMIDAKPSILDVFAGENGNIHAWQLDTLELEKFAVISDLQTDCVLPNNKRLIVVDDLAYVKLFKFGLHLKWQNAKRDEITAFWLP